VLEGKEQVGQTRLGWDGALYITLRLKRGYTAAPPHLSLAEMHVLSAFSPNAVLVNTRSSNTMAIKVP
jgi:hypothetical protein